ncbi:uncharacterized protein LOC123005706 isoform X2 [Tribolium madens]|uniref:uncharacterized protein LOC123005706 isoform X2 n=1 Tax=Tribolium madens TaxID=41895 RepID=UPI001CF7677F|nr:uncharacterized protein LOC123005706 isoform X2 [Tribolium madens]
MSELTKVQKNLLTIGSSLGIFEGAVWFLMSLVCIVEYLISDPPSEAVTTYANYYNYFFYNRFLNRKIMTENVVINPDTFHAFMWIYLILNATWIGLSVYQLRLINIDDSRFLNVLKYWEVDTILISFLDLLFVILLGVDYDKTCFSGPTNLEISKRILLEAGCTNATITVLVVAAKGFILWIINVIFIYIFYGIIRKAKVEMKRNREFLKVPQIPRPTLSRSPDKMNNNLDKNYWNTNSPNFNYNKKPNQQRFSTVY